MLNVLAVIKYMYNPVNAWDGSVAHAGLIQKQNGGDDQSISNYMHSNIIAGRLDASIY